MGRVRIKMCGLVRPGDVAEAVQLGAEYLGFVFAEASKRTVSAEHVLELLARVDTRDALRVGVFRDQPATWVNAVVERCRLDLVQLHGSEPRDYPSAIRVPVVQVVRVQLGRPESLRATQDAVQPVPAAGPPALAHAGPPRQIAGTPLHLAPNVQAVLLDAEDSQGQSGGLGLAPDLATLVAVRSTLPNDARVFVSGGLTPENVAERVRALRPWAVDVSSGIESSPGVKDPARMAAFVAALEKTA